jgi:hypothetical protein
MSWNFTKIGKANAVKASVAAEQYVPQSVKDVVAAFADAQGDDPSWGLKVSTHGHLGGAGSSLTKFEIEAVQFVAEIPVETATPPQPPPEPAPAPTTPEAVPATSPS